MKKKIRKSLISFRKKMMLIVLLFYLPTVNAFADLIVDSATETFTLTDTTITNAEGWGINGDDEFDLMPEDAADILNEKLSKLSFKVVNHQISVVDQFGMTTTVTYDAGQSSLIFFAAENIGGLDQVLSLNAEVVDTNKIVGTFEYEYITTMNDFYLGNRCNGKFEASIEWVDCAGCRFTVPESTTDDNNSDDSSGGCFVTTITY